MMTERAMQELERDRESKMLIAPYAQGTRTYEHPVQELSMSGSPRLAELPLGEQDAGAAGRLQWSSRQGGYTEHTT